MSWWLEHPTPEGFTALAATKVYTDLDGLMRKKDRATPTYSGVCKRCGEDIVGLRGLNCAKCRRKLGEGRAEGENRRGIAKGKVKLNADVL